MHGHRLIASVQGREDSVCFDVHFHGFGMWKSLDIHLTGQNTGRVDVVLLQDSGRDIFEAFQLSMLWWIQHLRWTENSQ